MRPWRVVCIGFPSVLQLGPAQVLIGSVFSLFGVHSNTQDKNGTVIGLNNGKPNNVSHIRVLYMCYKASH